MDRKEKSIKRECISQKLDLSGCRLKDAEVERLHDFVTNREKYDGQTKTKKTHKTDWDHDGKYERETVDTYTVRNTPDRCGIDCHSETYDDGALTYSGDSFIGRPRDILGILNRFFPDSNR